MSGLAEPRLLIASHIVPWSKDKTNRLNPSNGLCLSAIHDRAFDQGFIPDVVFLQRHRTEIFLDSRSAR